MLRADLPDRAPADCEGHKARGYIAHGHDDSQAHIPQGGKCLQGPQNRDAEDKNTAEIDQKRDFCLPKAVEKGHNGCICSQRDGTQCFHAVDGTDHFLEGWVPSGKETADGIQKEQGEGHEEGPDAQADNEDVAERFERALRLPGSQALADDGGAALLKAVLRIGGNSAQIVGDAEGSHREGAVYGAHRVDDNLAEGECHFLDDNGEGQKEHGADHPAFQGDCAQRKAECISLPA